MSMACTRNATPCRAGCLVVSAALLALVACGGEDDPEPTPTPTPVRAAPTPTGSAPTAEIEVIATATLSSAMAALLAPGPTLDAPARFFFRNGDDLWQQPADGPATQVTRDLRVGLVAQTPDGSRAAIVVAREDAGEPVEELRLVGSDGAITDAIFGPVPAQDGSGVTALGWSWAGASLAIGLDDGTITLLDAFGGQVAVADAGTASGQPVTSIAWAPSGAGLALLQLQPDEAGGAALLVAPEGEPARLVVDGTTDSARSIATFAWLPGRGRIAFVEGQGPASSPLAGSIFTIAPDGSARELLVSAGQFAPAARVVALCASPDGRELAFTVYLPDSTGALTFASLWVLTIDTGELREIPVEPGYRVTEVWWTAPGLVWRGVDIGEATSGDGMTYTGDESFILGRFDPAAGTTTVIYPVPGAAVE
jgi:hypothetical protein